MRRVQAAQQRVPRLLQRLHLLADVGGRCGWRALAVNHWKAQERTVRTKTRPDTAVQTRTQRTARHRSGRGSLVTASVTVTCAVIIAAPMPGGQTRASSES